MNLLIDLHRRIHITSAGNTDPTAAVVKTRQKPKVSITFTDASLADTTTTAVTLALKVTKTATTTASTVTLARVSTSLVYQGYLDLTTDIITALTDGQEVYMEASWVLDTDKPQRTDDATLKIQRSIITGTEGEPDPEQSTADRLTWLTSYILAGEGITIDEDPDTGAITLNASASGASAWADITGKPSTFPPDAHTQAISTITDLQTALDGKAPLASPALTGTPTVPTATGGTNTTQAASTAFVAAAIAALVTGKVLQCVTVVRSETAENGSPASTPQAAITTSFTPHRADSTLLIVSTLGIGNYTNAIVFGGIYIDGVAVGVGDAAGNRNRVGGQIFSPSPAAISMLTLATCRASGGTSALTIDARLWGSSGWYLNRSSGDIDSFSYSRSASHLFIIEVAP